MSDDSRGTVRLKATARQMYAGRALVPNDEFDATDLDAADLIAMGFAEKSKEEPKPRRTYERRDMKAKP